MSSSRRRRGSIDERAVRDPAGGRRAGGPDLPWRDLGVGGGGVLDFFAIAA
jgi:hypothetical protein